MARDASSAARSWTAKALTEGPVGGRLVEVDGHVGLFLPDHLEERVGEPLREIPVGPTRVGPVEVPRLVPGQRLPGHVVRVNVGVRP